MLSISSDRSDTLYARRSFWYLRRNGVPFSSLALKFGNYPTALTNDLLYEAQSVYFFTLVVMQWGCVIPWCVSTGELKDIYTHTATYSQHVRADRVFSSSRRRGA